MMYWLKVLPLLAFRVLKVFKSYLFISGLINELYLHCYFKLNMALTASQRG